MISPVRSSPKCAGPELHQGRGFVGEHGAPVFEAAAQHHDPGDEGKRQGQRLGARALEHLGQQPAEQRQARDADRRRDQRDCHRAGDAPTLALGEDP